MMQSSLLLSLAALILPENLGARYSEPAGEMAWRLAEPVTNADDLGSIPELHVMEAETPLP